MSSSATTPRTFLLTARKNNAAVILVTQEPQHLLDGAFGSTMIDQCHTKISSETRLPIPLYRDQLHLTEGEFNAIREGMLSGLAAMPDHAAGRRLSHRRFRSVGDAEFVAVLSGRANTVRFAKRLRTQSGADWVAEFQRRHKEVVE